MKKIFFKLIVSISLTIQVLPLLGQEVEENKENENVEEISLTGSLDSYFHRSIGTLEKAPRTSFSNLPGFSLGMINLVGTYTGKKAGFVADLVFGPRGSDAIFNAPLYKNAQGGGSAQIINQMYVYYQLSKKLKVNMGQFNTFLGYEMISPTKNFHYSTTYLFSFGPFNHTGIWVDYNLESGWGAKFAIMNPTDYTEYNPFDSYTLGGQISYSKNEKSIYLNATYGDPDGKLQNSDSVGCVSSGNAFQIDVTTSWTLSEKYSVGLGSSYRTIGSGEVRMATSDQKSSLKSHGFYGVALYQKIIVSNSFSLGLRTEYFSEFKNGVGAIMGYNAAGSGSVTDITLSANVSSSNFRFIPEIRFDRTSEKTFTSVNSSKGTQSMVSLNFAVVYAIPTFTHKVRPGN